jgi:phage terminase small subunit
MDIYSVKLYETQPLGANPVQHMTKALPAPADELTPAQHRFVVEYMEHGNATAAYRVAFDTNHAAVRVDACRLLRVPTVAARVAELRAIAADALNTSVAELVLQAHEIATASVHDLQPVEVYACRVCHSADGRHPAWVDVEEYADACEAWAASQDSPKPLKKPSAAGGFNHDVFAAPSPSCKACRGHGVPVMRTLPTAELSPGARALYAGATVGSDGQLRVMVEDRAKWADMRNKLIGAYAPTKVEGRHAHLHVHRQTPDNRAPMSTEDAIALLEQTP